MGDAQPLIRCETYFLRLVAALSHWLALRIQSAIVPSMRNLKTAKEVVERLGGLPRVAKLAETDIPTAKNWPGRAKSFPASTYVVMQRALRRRGARAPARLWNMRGV
jgi:hypothetical protein